MTELLRLNRGTVHLWYAHTDDAQPQEWLARYAGLLSAEERARHQRFVFQKDRDQFLIARVLLRTTLSRYSAERPEDWRFQSNQFGKPEIQSSQSTQQLRFNLSHCDGLILCGVTVGCDIGVDCENINRPTELADLVPRVFSAREQEFLKAVPDSMFADMFFRFWTLKEAYVKARGLGMSLLLPKISFEISETQRIRIFFRPEIQDRPGDWQFLQPTITDPYIVALAINLPQEETLSLELRKAYP